MKIVFKAVKLEKNLKENIESDSLTPEQEKKMTIELNGMDPKSFSIISNIINKTLRDRVRVSYGMDANDAYSEIWYWLLSTVDGRKRFPDLDMDDAENVLKHAPLLKVAIRRKALDILRFHAQTDKGKVIAKSTDIQATPYGSSNYRGKDGEAGKEGILASDNMTGADMHRVSSNRYKNQQDVITKDEILGMYKAVLKRTTYGSNEWVYILGMLALIGNLDYLRGVVDREDLEPFEDVRTQNDLAKLMKNRSGEPLTRSGDKGFGIARRKVIDSLVDAGYTL